MRISLIIITSRMPVLRTEHSLYTSEYWVGISDSIILCCDRINIFLPSLTIILPTIALSYVKWLQCCSQPHTGPRAPSLPSSPLSISPPFSPDLFPRHSSYAFFSPPLWYGGTGIRFFSLFTLSASLPSQKTLCC